MGILTAFPALVCYLILVRVDSGNWSLVHPFIPFAIRNLRRNWILGIILTFANISYIWMFGTMYLDGSLFSEFGLEAMGLLVPVWIIVHFIVISILRDPEFSGDDCVNELLN